MYRQVAAYLETKPAPPEGNPKRADEARAAVAVCLRWGSYFAVLADPARPPSPHVADEQVSRIDDGEMARMNVEISAALACGSACAGRATGNTSTSSSVRWRTFLSDPRPSARIPKPRRC